jgi:hypothetical protein
MVRVETDMSAQMGHVRFSPDSGNITDIAALRICGQTEKHSARADVFRSSPKNGRWFSRPKHYADRTLWKIRRTTALRQERSIKNVFHFAWRMLDY